ncbi:SHISA4 [Branchiostoma lanceolatum]|uniref:SHISA4 protein n=1 Tax=Branchiostoma lanceolatum TaxID=7740 RepID=A0A8J9V7N2_BRALA|nr:SHISA4 [Branchiostoma lanceolatum]
MTLYLLMFVLAASFTPDEAERCSSYRDWKGIFHPGFTCPNISRGDHPDEIYCCGRFSNRKYCCGDCRDKINNPCGSQSDHDTAVAVVISVVFYVFLGIAVCLIIRCCCSKCKARQERAKAYVPVTGQLPQQQTTLTVTTAAYPTQGHIHYPPDTAPYPPLLEGGYPPARERGYQATMIYPHPPAGGFIAPPPNPTAPEYHPAYPGHGVDGYQCRTWVEQQP